jgi:predicted metalloendopeptidase
MIKFLKQDFETEDERNAYVFDNYSNLSYELKNNIGSSTKTSVWVGIILGIILGLVTKSWLIFFAEIIILPIATYYSEKAKLKNLDQYNEKYESFLDSLEKELRSSILNKFNKRYIDATQQLEHVSDLVNLINHKKKLNLSDNAGRYILGQENIFRAHY